jgi:hypothetical protein
MFPDFVTLGYSSAGVPLWTNTYHAVPEAMVVDNLGHVYVTGFHYDIHSAIYATGYATVAYSAAGLPLWTNAFSAGFGNDRPVAVAADGARVYVTGASEGSGTGPDFVTIAYSQGGMALWTNRYNGSANGTDQPSAIAVDTKATATGVKDSAADTNAAIYVTGISLDGSGTEEWATVAYSSSGVPVWTNLYHEAGSAGSFACAVATDGSGDVIVTGVGNGTGTADYVTIAYSRSGIPLWTNRYNGPDNGGDEATAVAVLQDGSIYVAGYSAAIHSGITNRDIATIKYVPVPDILLSGARRLPDATFRFAISAPTNITYRLEASPDLSNWLPLAAFSNLPLPSIQYTDTLAPSFPRRFYRTSWSP